MSFFSSLFDLTLEGPLKYMNESLIFFFLNLFDIIDKYF